MPYIGNQHNVGDHVNNFKVLDDISSYTATFDGSATSVVSTSAETIRIPEHRFIQGQRVTYNNGGGSNIGGLTSGTAYYVSFDSANTVKLATSLANANSNTVINLSSVGGGTSHTLNAAFDGINTKFKLTFGSGNPARLNNATQINVAINNVIQRPNLDANNFTDGFALADNHKIVFKTAPTSQDIFWGSIIANTIENFDLRDNEVDNFTGNGSITEFTLSTIPSNNESVIVTIDGVLQHPSDKDTERAYTLIDSILKFTTAPALNAEIQARHIGFAGATTGDVSGFYGRTGNVVLGSTDHITTGDITSRNINASGIITAASANFGGNVSIGGTLTYEDVANIDSVGIITARGGIHVIGAGSSVGIGTTNPSTNLHISGSGAGQNTLRVDSSGQAISIHNHSEFIGYIGNQSGKLFINAGGAEDTLLLKTNGSERARITNSGVGIGSAIPTAKLETFKSGTTGYLFRAMAGLSVGNRPYDLKPPSSDSLTEPFSWNTGNAHSFQVDGVEKFRIDSNGRALFSRGGLTASRNVGTKTGEIQVANAGNSSAITIIGYSNDVGGPHLMFGKSRAGNATGSTILQDGDRLGEIAFCGADGNDIDSFGAAIKCHVDGTPGANDMPGRLQFYTTPDGGSASLERLRIDSDGRLLLGTTTAGFSTADDLTIATSGSTGITIRTGTTNQGNIYFADGTSGASQYAGLISYNHNTNHMFFGTADGTERLRIQSDGNIQAKTGTQFKGFHLVKSDGGTVAQLVGHGSDNDEGGVNLWDNGTKKVQILANGGSYFMGGRIGIGTESPTVPLVVRSSDNTLGIFTSTDSGANIDLFDDDTHNRIRSIDGRLQLYADFDNQVADSTIRFFIDGNNEKVRITGVGSFGIGTTDPEEKLDVAGHIKVDSGPVLENSASGDVLRVTSPTGYVEIGSKNSSYTHFGTNRGKYYFDKRVIVNEGIIGSYDEDLVLTTDIDDQRLRIKNDTGYIGINNSAPEKELHVHGSALIEDNIGNSLTVRSTVGNGNDPNIVFEKGRGGGTPAIVQNGDDVGNFQWRGYDGNSYETGASILGEVEGTPADGDMPMRLTLKTRSAGAGSEQGRLQISADGTVSLVNNSNLQIPDKIIHSGDTDTAIRFPAADTISAETGGSERLRIDSNGQVGINTDASFGATNNVKLLVNGDMALRNSAKGDSSVVQIGSYGKAMTMTTSAVDVLRFNAFGNGAVEITVFRRDTTNPQGAQITKLYIAFGGSGNNITSASLVQEDKVTRGSIHNFTYTISENNTYATLTATGNNNGGEAQSLDFYCISSGGNSRTMTVL